VFLGIDLGTSSAKAMLLSAQAQPLASASSAYAVEAPQEGWGETHPHEWWRGVKAAVSALPPAERERVRAVGFSGQMHGVVLCDLAGVALRPAILWLDARGADFLGLFPGDTGARTGNRPAAGMAAASLLWLKNHDPGNYSRAAWALQAKDWLRMQLCGLPASDPSDSTGTLLADGEGVWDLQLAAALALRADLLPPVIDSCAVAGTLSAHAAAELGLPAGIPLATGAGDTAAAAFGSGLLRGGEAQLTIGTGGQIVVMSDQRPAYCPELNSFRSANPPNHARWYVMAAMQNAGLALEWARKLLNLTWEEAYRAAESSRITKLTFLPYLSGERTPLMDANARGGWLGLSKRDDNATMMRAAFEGVAFSLRAGLEALLGAGFAIPALRLAGGGSIYPWWRQLLADVLERALHCVDCPDASARGAALLAGMAAGHWSCDSVESLAPPITLSVVPQPSHDLLQRFARFQELYPLLKEWF
jgi:xylulokinase